MIASSVKLNDTWQVWQLALPWKSAQPPDLTRAHRVLVARLIPVERAVARHDGALVARDRVGDLLHVDLFAAVRRLEERLVRVDLLHLGDHRVVRRHRHLDRVGQRAVRLLLEVLARPSQN